MGILRRYLAHEKAPTPPLDHCRTLGIQGSLALEVTLF